MKHNLWRFSVDSIVFGTRMYDSMNIGIVTTWFERGAAYVSKAYMDILSGSHNVYVYARGGEMQAKGDPVWDLPNVTWAPILDGPFCGGIDGISRFHLYRWIKKNHIEVIFFNEQRDIRIVKDISDLGYTTGAYIDYYTKNTVPDFNAYDFLICNTKRHYSVFEKHRKCLFIQWGTDINLFCPTVNRPIEENRVIFFHSAGMGAFVRKGADLLVRAFQHVTGNASLLIHSQVPLDRFGEEIKTLVENDARIEFIEQTVPAPGLFHRGDVYVYPSRLEGIGLTIPEALASGLPVITTDEMPMNEFVKVNYNGLLVNVSSRRTREDGYYWPESIVDITDLAQKMQDYVDNPKLIAQHSLGARASAEQSFNWEKNSKELASWFTQLRISDVHSMIGIRRAVRWCLFDFFLIVQSSISKAVKLCISSKDKRQALKRFLGLRSL